MAFDAGRTKKSGVAGDLPRNPAAVTGPASFFKYNEKEIGLAWRFLAATIMGASELGFYFVLTFRHSVTPTAVVMPSWVPFWPVFAVPYFGMLLLAWLLPAAIRDPGRFWACLRAMACAFLLIVPWWILFPTRMERPPMPAGWWVGPYAWLAEVDPPNCVLPCGHVIGAAAVWFIRLERPTWRWPLVALLVVGFVSIAVTGQHRPVDILIGTAATGVGIYVAEMWRKRSGRVSV
jgi:hypothetical protein